MNYRVLQINTNDIRGGAAQVANSIHKELIGYGHGSFMYVDQKFSQDENVITGTRKYGTSFLSLISKKIIGKDLPSFIILSSRDLLRKLIANDIEGFNYEFILASEEYQYADVVHLHNLHGNFFHLPMLVNMSQEKKLIWTLHDMWTFTGHCAHSYDCERWQTGCGKCPYLRIYPALMWDNTKTLLNKKEEIYTRLKLNIVSPSLWLKEKIKKSILQRFPVNHIPNGIDIKIFKSQDKNKARKELDLPKNKKIICFIADGGAQSGFKGWEYTRNLITFYRSNQNILFLCLGNKQTEKREKRGNVWYQNYISDQNELAKYYSASDIFLFTSLAENFPLVILEAMSCGTPIVSFDVGGVKEAVIHKENGYIAKYKDINNLKCGINYIFNLGTEELKAISNRSRTRVENNFSLKIMIYNYLKLYEKILNE